MGRTFFLQHGTDRTTTTIGRYGIITLAEARTAARRILAQKTLGMYQKRSVKFSEACDTFVKTHCADIKTGCEYERMLKREFLPTLRSKTLDKITPKDLYDILDKLSRRSPPHLRVPQSFLQLVHPEGLSGRHPVCGR